MVWLCGLVHNFVCQRKTAEIIPNQHSTSCFKERITLTTYSVIQSNILYGRLTHIVLLPSGQQQESHGGRRTAPEKAMQMKHHYRNAALHRLCNAGSVNI
jgi:hypothetical protein